MKTMILSALAAIATFPFAAPAFAGEITDVAICSAECRSEGLGILGHDLAEVGTIYYAPASETANLTTTQHCLSNAKEVKIYSDRLEKNFQPLCISALRDEYFGKSVTLKTEEIGQIQGGFTGEPIPAIGVTRISIR